MSLRLYISKSHLPEWVWVKYSILIYKSKGDCTFISWIVWRIVHLFRNIINSKSKTNIIVCVCSTKHILVSFCLHLSHLQEICMNIWMCRIVRSSIILIWTFELVHGDAHKLTLFFACQEFYSLIKNKRKPTKFCETKWQFYKKSDRLVLCCLIFSVQ